MIMKYKVDDLYERESENLNRATECQSCSFERALCLQCGVCLLCEQEKLINGGNKNV